MTSVVRYSFLLLCVGAVRAFAQLEVLPAEEPLAVFPGANRPVRVFFRNAALQTLEVQLNARLYQLSSSVVMPVGEVQPLRKLTVLGGQTVVESPGVKFPEVRATTRFQVRWEDDAGKMFGQTLVTVYPTNLLKELAALAGEKPMGLFDPQGRLALLLSSLEVEFTDLGQGNRLDYFHDRLAIIGPFDAARPMPKDLHKRVRRLTAGGVGVVLIAPQPWEPRLARLGVLSLNGRLVSIAPETIENIDSDPAAQETLLQCARLALNPTLSLTDTEL